MIADTETLEPRMMRGYEIVASYPITQRNAHSFLVPSQSSDKQYEVTISSQDGSCTCPDHTYRKTQCKHIVAVKLWLALKEKLTVRQVEETETVACKFCNSLEVVKTERRTASRTTTARAVSGSSLTMGTSKN
jgi:hypothetical protein